MTNIIMSLLLFFYVFALLLLVNFLCFRTSKGFAKKNKFDAKISYISISSMRTLHVIALIGTIYFIPLLALIIGLVYNSILVGPIILLILVSTKVVTNKIIIPASENKHIELYKKYYGENSSEYQFLVNSKLSKNYMELYEKYKNSDK